MFEMELMIRRTPDEIQSAEHSLRLFAQLLPAEGHRRGLVHFAPGAALRRRRGRGESYVAGLTTRPLGSNFTRSPSAELVQAERSMRTTARQPTACA